MPKPARPRNCSGSKWTRPNTSPVTTMATAGPARRPRPASLPSSAPEQQAAEEQLFDERAADADEDRQDDEGGPVDRPERAALSDARAAGSGCARTAGAAARAEEPGRTGRRRRRRSRGRGQATGGAGGRSRPRCCPSPTGRAVGAATGPPGRSAGTGWEAAGGRPAACDSGRHDDAPKKPAHSATNVTMSLPTVALSPRPVVDP